MTRQVGSDIDAYLTGERMFDTGMGLTSAVLALIISFASGWVLFGAVVALVLLGWTYAGHCLTSARLRAAVLARPVREPDPRPVRVEVRGDELIVDLEHHGWNRM